MSGTGNGSRHCGCVAQNFRKAESGPFQTITLKEGEKQTTEEIAKNDCTICQHVQLEQKEKGTFYPKLAFDTL